MAYGRREIKIAAKLALRAAKPNFIGVSLLYSLLTAGLALGLPMILYAVSGGSQFFYLMAMGYDPYELMQYYMGSSGTAVLIFTNVLISLFGMVVTFGYTGYLLRLTRKMPATRGNLLDGFGTAVRVILLHILMAIFESLWAMLFIVPGIIAAYRYRMAIFIILDDPDCGPLEAIRRSKEMMRGHKADLFVLDLSFLNWYLPLAVILSVGFLLMPFFFLAGLVLVCVCWAVMALWVVPYALASVAGFYEDLLGGGPGNSHPEQYPGPEIRF